MRYNYEIPMVKLCEVALNCLRWLQLRNFDAETVLLRWKVALIERIHGEQSKWGW